MSDPVIIIGGGIVGLSTAFALRKRDIHSIVLDRDRLGDGASYGNAGLIVYGYPPINKPGISRQGARMLLNRESPLYIKPRLSTDLMRWLWGFNRHCTKAHLDASMEVLAEMGWQSKRTYEEILEETGIDCDWRPNGWIDVCSSMQSLDEAEKETELVSRYGFPATRLEGDAFHQKHPGFTEAAVGAIHYTDSATICPHSFSSGLSRVVLENGTPIREQSTVQEILHNDGRIRGVRLESGEIISSTTVVLAAGTWSTALAKSVGLRIPMEPARGYHRDLRGLPCPPAVGGVIRGTAIAFTPMFDRLRLAGTLELAGHGRPWIRSRLDALTKGARHMIRDMDRGEIVAEWAGYRPCTHDGLPVVGPTTALQGLFVATGHAMMGMTLGPFTGTLVAEMICGEKPSLQTNLLRTDRFS